MNFSQNRLLLQNFRAVYALLGVDKLLLPPPRVAVPNSSQRRPRSPRTSQRSLARKVNAVALQDAATQPADL